MRGEELLARKMLDHPFYRAWEKGQVPVSVLSAYAQAYLMILTRMPDWWKKAGMLVSASDHSLLARIRSIVEEERNHVLLWKMWMDKLPSYRESGKEIEESVGEFLTWMEGLTPSQVLGAIHSFEIQQPEVSRTKKQGLIRHYGFSSEDSWLAYFDEHMREERHIGVGEEVARKYASREEFEEGVREGSLHWYNTLDVFAKMSGIQC